MAVGFVTDKGTIIGGKLGEALAKANPSRGVSYADTNPITRAITSSRTSSGGSSSRRSSSSSSSSAAATTVSTQKTAAEIAAEKKASEAAAAAAKQETIKRIFLSQQQQSTAQSSLLQSQSTAQTGAQRFQQTIQQKAEAQRQKRIQELAAEKAAKADKKERFRIGLNTAEKQMTTKEVISGRFKEVGVGISKAGIAIGEGAVNLLQASSVQTFKVDEATGQIIKPERFEFKGAFAQKIKSAPLTTGSVLGGTLVFAPLAGASVASTAQSVSTIGVRATAAETASSFSPLKIRAGTFGGLTAAEASKTRFDVVSQKVTANGKTFRFVSGKGGQFGDISIFSRQVSSKGVGVAQTNIISQETKYIGGKFIPQIRTIQANQIFTSKAGAATKVFSGDIAARVSLNEVFGSGSASVTTKLSQTIVSPGKIQFTPNLLTKPLVQTAAGTSTQKDALTFFAAGKATGAGGILRTSRANIRGVEIDLTKVFGSGAGTTIVSPGTGLKQSTSQAAQQISSALTAPKITPAKITTPSTVTAILPLLAPQKTTTPTAIIAQQSKSEAALTSIPKVKEEPITATTPVQDIAAITTTTQATTPLVVQQPRSRSGSKTRQDNIPKLDTIQNQIPEQKQKTTPALTLRQKLTQIPRQTGIPAFPTVPRITETPKVGFSLKLPVSTAPRSSGSFGVQIRRSGQFFSLGNYKTQSQAFQKGLEVTSGTLAATFKLIGPGKTPGAPTGFRRKKTDEGFLFIEKRGKRLSKKSETLEIQLAKSRKTKSRKKKR